MENKYNSRNPSVKRLMKEAIELRDPTPMYCAQPLEENLFEWHFTIIGPPGSDFEGGQYHGRILLPPEYPMRPPSIIMLTPNGRFELHQKICLSASSYHPELWQPSWSIRTVLLAIIGFMPTEGLGTIGSIDCPPEERRRLARKSLDWACPVCGSCNREALPRALDKQEQKSLQEEAASIAIQMAFKSEAEVKAAKAKMAATNSRPKEEASSTIAAPETVTAASSEPNTQNSAPSATKPSGTIVTHRKPITTPVSSRGTHQQAPGSRGGHSSKQGKGYGSLVVMVILVFFIVLLLLRRLMS